MKNAVAAAVYLAAVFVSHSAMADTAEQIAKGEMLSRQLCAICHQIGPEERRPVRVYNPRTRTDSEALTFQEIARRNGRDPRFLSDILREPHYPMRRRSFSRDDTDAIIAYIQSLRQ